jgi:hypothetical protein
MEFAEVLIKRWFRRTYFNQGRISRKQVRRAETMSRKIFAVVCFLVASCFFAGASWAGSKLGTAPGARSGLIQTNQHIYCLNTDSPADLSIAVVFPKNLDPVWTGQADAWLVIWMPGGTDDNGGTAWLTAKLTGSESLLGSDPPNKPRNLITIPGDQLSLLPPGDYQMGLILTKIPAVTEEPTKPAVLEDPTQLDQWYGGFSGLVSVSRIVITADPAECAQTVDSDGFTSVAGTN